MSARFGVGIGGAGPFAERFVRCALDALRSHPRLSLLGEGRRYTSPLLGGERYARVCNTALLLETPLSPEALLSELFALERRFGRVRSSRNAPRSLDLDLLWTSGLPRATARLMLPHPRLSFRAFALLPLLDAFEAAGVAPPLALLEAGRRTRAAQEIRAVRKREQRWDTSR